MDTATPAVHTERRGQAMRQKNKGYGEDTLPNLIQFNSFIV